MQATASASATSNKQLLLEAQGRLSSAGLLWTTTRTWRTGLWRAPLPDEEYAYIIQSAARGWLARLRARRRKGPKSARKKNQNVQERLRQSRGKARALAWWRRLIDFTPADARRLHWTEQVARRDAAEVIQERVRAWLARLHERRVGEKRPKSARHKHH